MQTIEVGIIKVTTSEIEDEHIVLQDPWPAPLSEPRAQMPEVSVAQPMPSTKYRI